jgi:hypothetical protein
VQSLHPLITVKWDSLFCEDEPPHLLFLHSVCWSCVQLHCGEVHNECKLEVDAPATVGNSAVLQGTKHVYTAMV